MQHTRGTCRRISDHEVNLENGINTVTMELIRGYVYVPDQSLAGYKVRDPLLQCFPRLGSSLSYEVSASYFMYIIDYRTSPNCHEGFHADVLEPNKVLI